MNEDQQIREDQLIREDQQMREAAMRLAIASCGERAMSFPDLIDRARSFEHYLRTGRLPDLPAGQVW